MKGNQFLFLFLYSFGFCLFWFFRGHPSKIESRGKQYVCVCGWTEVESGVGRNKIIIPNKIIVPNVWNRDKIRRICMKSLELKNTNISFPNCNKMMIFGK